MKILMTNAFYYPYIGGTEKHMLELSKRLAKWFDVHVLTSAYGSGNVDGVNIHRIPTTFIKMPLIYPPPLALAKKRDVEKVVKDVKPDVVNLHGRFFPSFAHAFNVAEKIGALKVFTLHNARPVGISLPIAVFGLTYDALVGRRVLRKADRIIAVSNAVKEDIAKYGIDKEKIVVIHNGVDTERFRPCEPFWEKAETTLIFVGRIIKQKGLETLIKAVKRLGDKKFRVFIVGKGKEREKLEKIVQKMGLSKKIKFMGFVPEEKLPNAYCSGDIFVLPSLWEVLPISLLEACSCGLPAVVSNAGGNPEIVEHGRNGFVFNTKDDKAMAQYLDILIEDEKLREKMGKESRKIALEKFDWDVIAKKTKTFYEHLVI